MTAPAMSPIPVSPSKSSARDARTSPVVGRRVSRDHVMDGTLDVFGITTPMTLPTASPSTISYAPKENLAGPSTSAKLRAVTGEPKAHKHAPPPIMLRRPTVSRQAEAEEDEEGLSALGELPLTPARGEFQRSIQSSPRTGLLASPRFQAPPSPAEQGRRIHARNLSLYFPQPGQAPIAEASLSPSEEAPVVDISSRRPAGMNGFKFGEKAPPGLAIPAEDEGAGGSRPNRRGHHHKHSLSHNFFSFLDPTATNANLGPPPVSPNAWPPFSPSPTSSDVPTAVPIPLLSSSSPTTLPSPYDNKNPKLAALSPGDQLALGFSIAEFFLGASLWVDGQAGGSVSVAGMGYLVVFDAIGVAVGVLGRKARRHGETKLSSVRRPFGSLRFDTLLYFVQCLFLVFAAVYIAKESIEHVLLEGHSHSHHHSAHDAQNADDFDEVSYPLMLLLYSTISAAFSGIFLSNHARLVEAVGPILLPPFLHASPSLREKTHPKLADRFAAFLGNPFSLAVSLLSAGMLLGGLLVSPSHMGTLDTSLSLLLAVSTLLLSHPPTVAFGHVLLQTAPSASADQMRLLRAAVELIEADERVRSVSNLRCWRVGAGAGPPPQISPRRSSFTPSGSPAYATFVNNVDPAAGAAQLVVTLVVRLSDSASDADVLSVTKTAWMRLSKALNDGEGAGEVCVMVRRGDGVSTQQDVHEHQHGITHDHGDHDHVHGSHDHAGHAHGQDGHGHEHIHGLDHGHDVHDRGHHSHQDHNHEDSSHAQHSHSHSHEDKHAD